MIDNNFDLEPSYDSDFANEVHNSTSSFINDIFSKNDHKQRYQAQPGSIKPTYDDDKMDSAIIFDDLNVETDSESVVQDTSAHDHKYVEFESLMRNVKLKADKPKRDNVLLKKQLENQKTNMTITTLAEHIIVVGAENRPPMLEKSMYDSWASHIRLFIKGKKNGRMMLDSIDNGPLQLQDDYDVQATNIILHGLPPDVYALVNHQKAAKDIWDRVKLLMKGTELSYQEHECRLYNLFDKLAYVYGETFKFVTDVKLAKSLYTTNYDQLYAYLSQYEQHANEVRIMRERYPDPLALVANSQTLYNPSQSLQHSDSCLVVPTFQQGDDPIECINKAMAFLSVVASRFPPSNNQLRMSSNPRNQATIQDGRVTVQ
ncbi:hypothetical protein Tco_0502865 [Tanacetum coccineum]